MKKLMFGLMVVLFSMTEHFSFTEQVSAGLIASDNASATVYDNGWQSGDNGGSGFAAWNLTNEAVAGFFLADSRTLQTANAGANINSSGRSFGMFANSGRNPFANADRNFSAPLAIGDSFSLNIAVNFRNGNKGFNLYSGLTQIFNFDIGGNDYRANNNSIGSTYHANTAFSLKFAQTTSSGGTWEVTRSGGVSDLDSGTYTGIATGFRLYNTGTEEGSPNDFFANNFSITAVPEPSSFLLAGLAGVAGLIRRRR